VKFSIIIPVHNAGQYLAACVDSVLAQTYQRLELILIDDGSKDESGKICDRYAELDPDRVKVFHNQNQGQIKARTCGIKNMSGDVALFIDSDDCLRSDALALLQQVFAQSPCDMVLFNAAFDEHYTKTLPGFTFENGQRFCGEEKKALYELLITTSKLNPLWLKAARKRVVEGVAARYSHFHLTNAGDLLFSLAEIDAAQNIVYLDQNLYYWRQRPGSIVHTYNPQRHQAIKQVHLEMRKYIDAWGMQEMHMAHDARKVRGWCDCVKLLLRNERKPKALLQEMAEDEYFRTAYVSMDRAFLSTKEVWIATWLYQRKYMLLSLLGLVIRVSEAVERILKGK